MQLPLYQHHSDVHKLIHQLISTFLVHTAKTFSIYESLHLAKPTNSIWTMPFKQFPYYISKCALHLPTLHSLAFLIRYAKLLHINQLTITHLWPCTSIHVIFLFNHPHIHFFTTKQSIHQSLLHQRQSSQLSSHHFVQWLYL